MADKPTGYKKYLVYVKDAVYIIGLVIALVGWISSKSESQAILETTVQYNTKTLEQIEPFILEQNKLNGKFLQHLEDVKNNGH